MEQLPHRTLTNEDVAAIVTELRRQITQQFFNDLGKGLWGLFRASLLAVILAVVGISLWLQAKGTGNE